MISIIVVGPLTGVYWRMVNGSKVYNPTETPNNNVVGQGAVVTLDHTNRKSGRSGKVRDLFCDVLFTNVAPQINITISSVNKEHVREITDRFGFTPFTRYVYNTDTQIMIISEQYYLNNNIIYFSLEKNV